MNEVWIYLGRGGEGEGFFFFFFKFCILSTSAVPRCGRAAMSPGMGGDSVSVYFNSLCPQGFIRGEGWGGGRGERVWRRVCVSLRMVGCC